MRHDDRSLSDYYSELDGTIDELDFYQPLVLDLKILQWYCDKLTVVKFLSRLDTSLGNQIRGQFLVVIQFLLSLPCLEFVVFIWEVILLLLFPLVLRTLLL